MPSNQSDRPIYYFGYGPIVNSVVRARRGVHICEEQAALLPEFRLTFAYGGVVNVVKQRGYEVYGVLMKFDNEEDWAKFQEFDAGYNLDQVQTYPLKTPDDPVVAYTFIMKDFDGEKLDEPIEKLPQERYLKLIAAGMRNHNIDPDYIEDQIMSVPYLPKTKPEDFRTFAQSGDPLPKITFDQYQEHLCRKAGAGDVYFISGTKVVRLDPHDPENPCAVWCKSRMHGEPDMTLTVHRTVVDPDLPMADSVEEITPAHIAWAEHHTIEYLEQGSITATVIFELCAPGEEGPPEISTPSWCSCCFGSKEEAAASNPLNSSGTMSPPSIRRTDTAPELDGSDEDSPGHNFISLELMRRGGDNEHDGDTDDDSFEEPQKL
jgi:hypothetical protein